MLAVLSGVLSHMAHTGGADDVSLFEPGQIIEMVVDTPVLVLRSWPCESSVELMPPGVQARLVSSLVFNDVWEDGKGEDVWFGITFIDNSEVIILIYESDLIVGVGPNENS